jgi:hypothetical protein
MGAAAKAVLRKVGGFLFFRAVFSPRTSNSSVFADIHLPIPA